MTRTADVVIVGGGCMGASVAFHLTQLGITNVVLVERDTQLGTGSTGRNAGGVRHQFSHDANIRLSLESIAVLERFQDYTGFPADLHQDGYLFLLSTPESVETFRRNVALQRSHGVNVDWLSPADAATTKLFSTRPGPLPTMPRALWSERSCPAGKRRNKRKPARARALG